jgi:hypothetical protein
MYPTTIDKNLKVFDTIPIFHNSVMSIFRIPVLDPCQAFSIAIYHVNIGLTLLKKLLFHFEL